LLLPVTMVLSSIGLIGLYFLGSDLAGAARVWDKAEKVGRVMA
jgi:hypothetical protein